MQVREDINGFMMILPSAGPGSVLLWVLKARRFTFAGRFRDRNTEGLVLKAHRLALLRGTFAMETRRIGPESTTLHICGQISRQKHGGIGAKSTPFGIVAGNVRDGNKEDYS